MKKYLILVLLGLAACSKSNDSNPDNSIPANQDVNVYFEATATNGVYSFNVTQPYLVDGVVRTKYLGGGALSTTLNFSSKLKKGDSVWVDARLGSVTIYPDTKLVFTVKTDASELLNKTIIGSNMYLGWVNIK